MTSTDLVYVGKGSNPKSRANLQSMRKGFDPRRGTRGGRSALLNNPEFCDLFAKAVANGLTYKELAEMFDIGERTVSEYKNDIRIKTAALKYIEERVLRVSRKVDQHIEKRLENAEELDTETLLKIRKEFLGGVFRLQTQGTKDDPNTINDAQDQIESDPEFAAELQELLDKQYAPAQ